MVCKNVGKVIKLLAYNLLTFSKAVICVVGAIGIWLYVTYTQLRVLISCFYGTTTCPCNNHNANELAKFLLSGGWFNI